MTTLPYSNARPAATRSASTGFYNWIITTLSLWLVGGLHLDAWAHHQFEVETFFTPWHGVLYSGFLALALVLGVTFIRNLTKGHAWQYAMPVGYELSLLGVAIFFAGGVGDMLWHIAFGIEVDIAALLSPTHLLLALGGGLIISGPIRAAWKREDIPASWAALVSLALLLSLLTFFTSYASPLTETQFAQGPVLTTNEEIISLYQSLGIAGFLIQTAAMMSLVLLIWRRWTLPFGSLTLILTLSTVLSVSVNENWSLAPFAILTGLAADVLVQWWNLSPGRLASIRWLAFVLPVIFYSLYFATLALTGGIWWTVHLWVGAIILTGIVGWLMSYAYHPQP